MMGFSWQSLQQEFMTSITPSDTMEMAGNAFNGAAVAVVVTAMVGAGPWVDMVARCQEDEEEGGEKGWDTERVDGEPLQEEGEESEVMSDIPESADTD